MKNILFILWASCCVASARAQEPSYTEKHFVTEFDTLAFKRPGQVKNGIDTSYLTTLVSFYDVDDNNTTHIRGNVQALLYVESQMKGGKKQGISRQFLIDSADHAKHYLIAEQTYQDDKLNGKWSVYNLKGTLVAFHHFKNDSLHGLTRQYWIDGKSIQEEQEYFNGRNKFIHRDFFKNGKVSKEIMFVNNKPNGEVKDYYETGIIKDKFYVKNGLRDGLRVYYYPDGKPWIEQIYKENKPWTVIANYDSNGNKRDAGTLKEGTGTLILYDDDVKIREIARYKNGTVEK